MDGFVVVDMGSGWCHERSSNNKESWKDGGRCTCAWLMCGFNFSLSFQSSGWQ